MKSREKYKNKFKILEKELKELKKFEEVKHGENGENVKVNGLKKVMINKEEYRFVCHKHYKKCKNCKINLVDIRLHGILNIKKCRKCLTSGCVFCIKTHCNRSDCGIFMCSKCSTKHGSNKCCKCLNTYCNKHILKLEKNF